MAKGQDTRYHPGRSGTRDAYDAYRDARLESGSWHDRQALSWNQKVTQQQYDESVAHYRSKNAMWPEHPKEHGPTRP